MSHDPAAVVLGSAGRGNAAHDQGSMRRDDAAEGAQDTATALLLSTKASNGDIKLSGTSETQEVQEQSTPLGLLGQDAFSGPDPSRDDAVVATRGLAAGATAHPHAHDDSTPIYADKLNGAIEGAQGEQSFVPLPYRVLSSGWRVHCCQRMNTPVLTFHS